VRREQWRRSDQVTHIEFAGGPAGPDADLNVFAQGDPRNSLSYTNIAGNVIIEDSWIFGTSDDGMRLLHGHVSVMRNTFEVCGTTVARLSTSRTAVSAM